MANRILIADTEGRVLYALDGHHGPGHAAAWAATVLAQLQSEGVEAMALEWTPEQGGDDCRCGVIGNIHRLRVELHQRPDGAREIVGLSMFPHVHDTSAQRAGVGAGRGLGQAQAAKPAERVRGGLAVVHAPAAIAGQRRQIRNGNGRLSLPPGMHHAERMNRRLQRGLKR